MKFSTGQGSSYKSYPFWIHSRIEKFYVNNYRYQKYTKLTFWELGQFIILLEAFILFFLIPETRHWH